MKRTVSALALVLLSTTMVSAQYADVRVPGATSTPPPPGAPRAFTVPTPVETTLPNGLRVIAVRSGDQPLESAQLVIRAGSLADPTDRLGLAYATVALLPQGSIAHDSRAIAAITDALGAQLTTSATPDASLVSINATSGGFSAALDVMSEIVRTPAFPVAEIERLRTRALGSLKLAYSSPSQLASLVARAALFGDGYGRPATGTPATLARITRDDIVRFHDRGYRPDRAILVLAGALEPEAAFAQARRTFGNWTVADATPLALPRSCSAPCRAQRVVVIDNPAAGRTAIALVAPALPASSPGVAAATVANSVLSGFSGRLNEEIRVKRGLSYGAGSSLDVFREGGDVLATTLVANDKAVEGTAVMVDTLASLGRDPLGEADLVPRRAVAVGAFSRAVGTDASLAATIATLALDDAPLATLAERPQRLAAVDAPSVQRFAQRSFATPTIVLVGNASAFITALRAKYPTVEVIPFNAIDLGSPSLRRP